MPNSIRLGLMPPLTGLVDIYGPEILWAARIACDEINEQGGLLGRQLELAIGDGGSLPDTAVPAARRLLDKHRCVALIGNLLSNSRIAVVAQVAEPHRIPLLNFSFYEGSISSRYFFHFAALPNQQIDKMIPSMAHRHGPKMFFAGNNYEWPRGSIDAAKRALQRLQGDVVGEEYLPLGAILQDIDSLLAQVARSGADVFVPYFAGQDQITLLTRFTERDLKQRMAVVMGHYDEMMVSRLPPPVREGFYSSNTYFMSLPTPENQHYLQRLLKMPGVTGIWPGGNGILTNFGEGAYLCVHAFANAVKAAGTTEAEALVDALEHVRVTGPQGLVEMDALTHHASVNSYLARCKADGTFSIVEVFGRNRPEIPERYRSHLPARLSESPITPEVSARLAAQVCAARRKLESAKHILAIADMAVLATDGEGFITEANRGASQLFGYTEEEFLGMSVHLLLPPHFRERHAELMKGFVEGEETERLMSGRREITGYRKDGSFFPMEASIAKSLSGDRLLLVVTMRDISVRKKAEEELTRQATHDTLTGLPNRALIRERLTNALKRSQRSGLSVALLFVDLDGFKLINDTHGHEAGDVLLKTVASRLLEQVRPGDTVGRLAGDEFIILCEQLEQPAGIAGLASRINESLREAIYLGDQPLFVTASIGVAIGNGCTHAADDLLRYADTAMYAVKEKGRDGWQFFSESLQAQAQQRMAITNGLRLAIERQELSTCLQPIISADSGQIVGAEILLRWHPEQGEVSPSVFIPIAEMTGTIVPIGAWVFREACRVVAGWHRLWQDRAPYISVNISTRQLSDAGLIDSFSAILAETGANPRHILLEITETSLMADVESNSRVLRRLAGMGLRVAVDDFGTGYSSLAQLSRLPVNVLKIDRAFVDGIDKSMENRTIIRAVIGLGRGLKLKLVAEGVETMAQYQELCACGCDLFQGYYFHHPMPASEFRELIERLQRDGQTTQDHSLHFLIFVSRALSPLADEEMAALQKQMTQANRLSGISGCLLHEDGQFIQMLEGPKEVVAALMERIRRDSRHADVRLVIEGPAKRRVFYHWGMVFKGFGEAEDLPDFGPWERKKITFMEMADDPRLCYSFLTSQASALRT